MKFVRTISGDYINITWIEQFYLNNGDVNIMTAFPNFDEGTSTYTSCIHVIKRFTSTAEAQEWLDVFVAKINEEDTHGDAD